MAPWFPALPCYGGYIQRLNRLHELFPRLVEEILNDFVPEGVLHDVCLVDSMPIVMAHEKRSSQAKVAPEIANKGYCASKGMYFYGVKVHLVAFRRPGTLPVPDYMDLSAGSANDLTVLRSLVPRLHDCEVYGDKIYADAELARRLERDQNVRLYRPIKKKKGQKELVLTDRVYSEIVSGVCQPIESFFSAREDGH